jgi:hypothetical protein
VSHNQTSEVVVWVGLERSDDLVRTFNNERYQGSFRKEVIQPQVLLQLPCYDFTPIMDHTVTTCLPEGLALPLLVQPTFVM